MLLVKLFLAFAFLANVALANTGYTEEVPVKVLNVKSVAVRYPAAASQFRTSIENGQDEDANRTEGDILNGFPALRMILNPGGCGFYQFPLAAGQIYAYVQPAKKQGELYQDYCDKAPITVDVSTLDDTKKTSFGCFAPDPSVNPCSSQACRADISAVASQDTEDTDDTIKVKLCTDPETNHLGAIWEVNFSQSNESNKLEGYFEEDARERFREVQQVPAFNTQLSMVSIVGARGVGKSTVASLLSGNSSMFQMGSASTGTTTTGADMSPAIPSTEWASVLTDKLGLTVTSPNDNLPLFLIDSEGMGVRGDAFDFMTTSPPAIIAKSVIWIGAENLQTVRILYEIAEYLSGLDNIIMSDDKKSHDAFCNSPAYGHLVIVINKMMGSVSDDELQRELMEPEPDYIDGSEERNQIRTKMQQCFDGVNVHGLPHLTIPPGEDLGYEHLSGRFKDGLVAIARSISERLVTPRTVTVAGRSMVLNATNAEVIIGTVIEEANKGKIDLAGFETFWTYVKQEVLALLGASEKDFTAIAPNCGGLVKVVTCTPCVCDYRNKMVTDLVAQVEQLLEMAKGEAQNLYGQDLSPHIAKFKEETISPWQNDHTCFGSRGFSKKSMPKQEQELCDLSVMTLTTPGQPIELNCTMLFTCNSITVDASVVTINADQVYVGDGATIKATAPPKAKRGADATSPGGKGGAGDPGKPGFNINVSGQSLIKGSSSSIICISKGGAGGDGGNGMGGASHMNNVPANPTNAKEVTQRGSQVDYRKSCGHHCGGHCEACDEHWYYALEVVIPSEACGGAGGAGGDGGDGGAAGTMSVTGLPGLSITLTQLDSAGGQAGLGSAGASGLKVNRRFTGTRRYWEDAGCHGFGGLVCGPSYHEQFLDYSYTNNDISCPGPLGGNGKPGDPWKP